MSRLLQQCLPCCGSRPQRPFEPLRTDSGMDELLVKFQDERVGTLRSDAATIELTSSKLTECMTLDVAYLCDTFFFFLTF